MRTAALLACWLVGGSQAQLLLTPAYFNIAENRPIKANATCGDTGLEKEPYCKLVGGGFSSNLQTGQSSNFKDGQVCDFCLPMSDATGLDRTKMHGPENANDGDISTWWQSPPISRGRKYNRVDLEIDLLQSFQVAYVVVTMADSPRPGVWALEKSLDNGSSWTPWQYFASNDAECQRYFNMHADERIIADDTVTCSTEFSKVLPLEGGEIFVALTTGRPSQNNIQESQVMLNWLTATNIRIRLMQTKTMLGHLMSVAQGDNTVTRRYYYAIKEISIGGRCVCNGHAYICPASPLDPNILQCDCQHGTTGLNCDECMDGYRQKNWRRHTRSDPFECEPCNCNKHSDKCHYNATLDAEGLSLDIHGHYEGGGQCDDCQHFTTGINCDTCVDGYFRPPDRAANDTTPCILCDCPDPRHTGNCEAGGGRCECKEAWRGADDCTECAQGFYGYPDCEPCPCSIEGTMLDAGGIPVCVTEGEEGTADLQCPCKSNFGGEFCDRCADGYYNYPECTPCGCNDQHSTTGVCNLDDGQCSCEVQYGGRSCEQCSDGHFDYPNCASLDSEPHQMQADLSKMARNQLEKMALELFIQLKNCHNKE